MVSRLKKIVEQYQVISIDIFDTALFRLFSAPRHVFDYTALALGLENFTENRILAAKNAREDAAAAGFQEIRLGEIYAKMIAGGMLSPEQAVAAEELERALELSCVVQNPEIFSVYQHALELKKTVVFTSDMYLDRDTIEKMLRGCGYEAYTALFLSSEDRTSKSSGERFRLLPGALGVRADEILHIGDHHISDVSSALKHGITAKLYPHITQRPVSRQVCARVMQTFAETPHPHASLFLGATLFQHLRCAHEGRQTSYWYWLAFQLTSVVLLSFCSWLRGEVRKKAIKKIFFLARDGLIMNKAFSLLYGETNLAATYTYASRKLYAKDKGKGDEYAAHLGEYLQSIGLCHKSETPVEPVAIVDVGRHSSIQVALENFLASKDLKADIHGFYVDLRKNPHTHIDQQGFFPDVGAEDHPFFYLLDFLLIADHPLIMDLQKTEQGIVPVFQTADKEEERREQVAAEMHAAVEDCLTLLAPVHRLCPLPPSRHLVRLMGRAFSRLSPDDLEWLSSMRMAVGMCGEIGTRLTDLFFTPYNPSLFAPYEQCSYGKTGE